MQVRRNNGRIIYLTLYRIERDIGGYSIYRIKRNNETLINLTLYQSRDGYWGLLNVHDITGTMEFKKESIVLIECSEAGRNIENSSLTNVYVHA